MNEIVANTVDVRVDHQRVNESENQHHPEWCMGVEEEQTQEIGEMKKSRRSRDRVPARVREELGVCRRTFYSYGVSGGHLANLQHKIICGRNGWGEGLKNAKGGFARPR